MSKSRARKKENRFVVFGDRELNRAVEMGYKIDTLFYREGCDEEIIEVQSEDVFELSTALFDRVSMRSGSEDVIAVLETKSHHINDIFVNNDSRILVLEAPEKPWKYWSHTSHCRSCQLGCSNHCQSQDRSIPPPNHSKQYGRSL